MSGRFRRRERMCHFPAERAAVRRIECQQFVQDAGAGARHADDHQRRLDRALENFGMPADPVLQLQLDAEALQSALRGSARAPEGSARLPVRASRTAPTAHPRTGRRGRNRAVPCLAPCAIDQRCAVQRLRRQQAEQAVERPHAERRARRADHLGMFRLIDSDPIYLRSANFTTRAAGVGTSVLASRKRQYISPLLRPSVSSQLGRPGSRCASTMR